MFLNELDLRQLTGLQRPSAQVRWLREKGWQFTVNALGRPVVANAEASRKLVGGSTKKREQPPNWDAMNGPSKAA